MISKKKNNELGYIPSLDGLRAIAVGLVMLTHANFQLGKNGIIGVAIFFCLSGFLITTILLQEFDENSNISLKAFYIRRTMRLLPALYIMLIFLIFYNFIFTSGLEQQINNQDVLFSSLYIYNIAIACDWVKDKLLLGHMWTLGIEEQFYIIWPFIVIILFKVKKK